MSLINVQNLTFSYPGSYDHIFENASFQLDTDWRTGFTGRNGRGKTTFLNLLMGKYPYEGLISASVKFDYFPFEVKDAQQLTLEIAGRIVPDGYEPWMLNRELSLLDVDQDVLYRPFSTLSQGERTKLLLAMLFLKQNNFLLIDEPTNHLDMEARAVVSKYLGGKNGYILVSHDRSFLDGCVDHILSINRANIEVQRGNFSSWYANKERQDGFELAENEKLKRDIKRLKQSARQSERWADKVESTKIGKRDTSVEWGKDSRAYIGEKSRRMQQRRKNLERRQQTAIEDKSALLKNIETAESLALKPLEYVKPRLLDIRDVSIHYGDKTVCDGINLSINRGDRIALNGKNGSGKSSLLKLILGQDIAYTGEIQRGSRLVISYVPQDTDFLQGSLKEYSIRNALDESLFKAILRKMDFSRVQFEKDMRSYSAGQKKKVLLAQSLCTPAHLYVWDEPLNYIDIYSRMQIQELILASKPTMLLVEHDRAFIEAVATGVTTRLREGY